MTKLMQNVLNELEDYLTYDLLLTTEDVIDVKERVQSYMIRYAQGIVPEPMLHSESGDTISEKGIGYQKCIQDILCKLQEDTDSLNNK